MPSLSQETAIRSLGLPANNSLTSHTNAHEAKEGKRKWINNTLFTLYACRCVINTVSGEVFGLFRGIKSITFWIIHYQIKKQIFLNLAVCLIFMKTTSTLNFTTCTNQSFFFLIRYLPVGRNRRCPRWRTRRRGRLVRGPGWGRCGGRVACRSQARTSGRPGPIMGTGRVCCEKKKLSFDTFGTALKATKKN